MATHEILILAVAAGIAAAGFVYACDRWRDRRSDDAPPFARRMSASHAALIGGAVFAFAASRAVPHVAEQEPWATIEAIIRLCLVMGFGYLLSMGVTRLLIKDP